MITELHYDNTNTYLISGQKGALLFDTGWAGTLQRFYRELGAKGLHLKEIDFLLISHYHPDHMGIAQEIVGQGVKLLVMESQVEYTHASDRVFEKDKRNCFVPIDDNGVKMLTFAESREFLQELGIAGTIIPTPGHSEDSISLIIDGEAAFVGDLYPLYELELHEEPDVKESWDTVLSYSPKRVYYGHAKTAVLQEAESGQKRLFKVDTADKEIVQRDAGRKKTHGLEVQQIGDFVQKNQELYHTVKQIMHYIDKGMSIDKIATKLKLERGFVNDVCRMYLTHQNVGVQGILDRIEIKGK